jgi:hypothetical protein
MIGDRNSYLGNPNLKKINVNVNFTPEQVEEYVKCSEDPVYFMKNYVKIVNLDRGLINFETYPFQEKMVRLIRENRFVIAKMPRQCGKSTTIISDILHHALFNENQTIAILANKEKVAKLHMDRLKMAYENLPKWLQQGIKEWNKFSVELENGSKVIASATSASAIRGGSFNYILLDEFAFVPENIANDFYSSVFPTISSGKTTKLVIISTPNGLNLYYKLWIEAIEGRSSFKHISVHWSDVPGRDKKWRDTEVSNLGEDRFRTEHECDFIGSTNTLISPDKLRSMVYKTPIHETEQGLKIYEKPVIDSADPKNNHTYVMTVDTARGLGHDYHGFAVFDITKAPYKIVATFRNNDISPLVYPAAIYPIAKQYNDAYILVEINDIGGQVADILHNEMEYENLLVSSIRGRKGQTLDGGFGNATQSQLGLRTTKAVKRLGCSVMKSLIEGDKLLISDYAIIQELVSFISKNNSFEADAGHTDDLVMCIVLFSWITTQKYFQDLTNMDIRKTVFNDKIKQMEDEMTPFGFIDDGSPDYEDHIDSSGTVWTNTDD